MSLPPIHYHRRFNYLQSFLHTLIKLETIYEKGSVKVKENMIAADMKQLLNSMENTIKLQNRARAEKRADKAAQEQQQADHSLCS